MCRVIITISTLHRTRQWHLHSLDATLKISNSQPNIVYYHAFWVYKWLSNTFINISFFNMVLKISINRRPQDVKTMSSQRPEDVLKTNFWTSRTGHLAAWEVTGVSMCVSRDFAIHSSKTTQDRECYKICTSLLE